MSAAATTSSRRRHLSGGNQQKVVLGKWLAIAPRILLLDEPTRGIDVGAKKEIYDLVFRLAEEGLAIVVVSSELPELLLLADRILVMREGRQAGILDRAAASEEAIMTLASPRRPQSATPPGRHARQPAAGREGRAGDRWRRGIHDADLRLLPRTKLYWGLAALFLIGVAFSPVTSKGRNIFLSYGNLSDVLRQVSITGLVAVGMTMVILIGGIDLSVGSILALGTVLAALAPDAARLDRGRRHRRAASRLIVAAVCVAAPSSPSSPASSHVRGTTAAALPRRTAERAPSGGRVVAGLARGGVARALAAAPGGRTSSAWWGVLVTVPCVGLAVGAINGAIIVAGRLQPFIVTLAMMVTMLGLARLIAGQDSAVVAVYSGTNATADIDLLRAVLWGVLPVPGLFFLAALAHLHGRARSSPPSAATSTRSAATRRRRASPASP